jgi:hypothetical protein
MDREPMHSYHELIACGAESYGEGLGIDLRIPMELGKIIEK